MLDAPPHRLQGVPNRPPGCGRRAQKAKKILNRRNEPKDLLETQHLAVFGAKNELKTNSILSAKSAYQSKKHGQKSTSCGAEEQVSGVGFQVAGAESGVRIQESGVRSENEEHLLPTFCLLLSAFCPPPHTMRRFLDGWIPHYPIIARLSSDREQRKNTRLSWVESLIDTFTLRADVQNGSAHKSEDNVNQ